MHLTRCDDQLAVELRIPIKPETAEVLRIQWGRLGGPEDEAAWAGRFRVALEPALAEVLDWDLRPPSKAQLDYALAITKALNISLPGEALLFGGAMWEFLDRHVPQYKSRRLKGGQAAT
ncbi:hypothetical protein [Lysobacter sp. FW306-1B-D06B]|uniref:hypothetical protein n=1 Tax=Lysobacter sp. FW306-1B-D06B TaxID=3140250 RepID=UPI0031408861